MTNIERLYEGSLDVPRRCGVGTELREVEGYLLRHRESLEKTLPEEGRSLLAKYGECVEEQLFLYGRECYLRGYSLGARLTAEALLSAELT